MTATKPATPSERIIVALDVPDRASALLLVERLSGLVGAFKIGMELYTAEGPTIVREVVNAGERVFLDLKFHDIPHTVAGASRSAAALGVSIFNLHTLGGHEMMRAAVDAVSGAAHPAAGRPIILGVTVLTSMDGANLAEVGIDSDLSGEVKRLAALAHGAGLDGVVASAREIRVIREHVNDPEFVVLTPGIRPAWSATGDQKRIATPASAIRDGADYIVIGRAITADPDPRGAALRIIDEL